MLRLTLRTLLAYLDDTLEPAQAKDIGKKVAESELAQETVERIKTVTRRRRLTAPAVLADDHSTDPNTIAEYLDNTLPPDQVTELEQVSLDNDVRLAEVAACHQILTLVLGEPARVPPTARRRMYRLVTGPESIPYRRAAATPVAGVAAPAEVDEFQDRDDDPLTSFLGTRKVLWLLWIFVAIGLLVLAVFLAVPPPPPQPTQTYVYVPPRVESPRPALSTTTVLPAPTSVVPVPSVPSVVTDPPIRPDIGPAPREVGAGPPAPRAPDSERRVVGVWDTLPQPLLIRKRDTAIWERVDPAEGRVSSTDTLNALPGFHPEVRLDSGVRLQLWANVPELLPLPLAETRLTLFVPAKGIDADFMLHGGRVFITIPTATRAFVVRVRIRNEVWDVTLNTPDAEVAIDVIGEPAKGAVFNRDLPESPRTLAYLGVLQGTASLRVAEFRVSGELAGGAKWKWDSKAGRPDTAPKEDPDEVGIPNRWTKVVPATPASKDMAAAVNDMARLVSASQGPYDLDFDATVKGPREAAGLRVLATRMLASIDSLGYLIDALENEAAFVRDAAAKSIRHWVAQDATREEALSQALGMKVAYSDTQRAFVLALLHGTDRPPGDAVDPLFDLLSNEKLAIRELVRMQLARLDPTGAKDSNYDAASDRRGTQAGTWKISYKKRFKG